jgi:uncharacterized protein (UPF0548 family)
MFFLTEPNEPDVKRFIARQKDLPFTYSSVGATNNTPPLDFTLDHNRILLGRGDVIFRRAIEALKAWKQFDLGWVTIVPAGVKLDVGATVAVKARAFGSWSLSAARVVYMTEESRRFGFAYGTLPDHVETGEERFTIEWDSETDEVWYDILAFSKPRHPLVRLTFPLARSLQKQFAQDSKKRMVELATLDSNSLR